MTTEGKAADNTGLAKVAVQCSADTFVINKSLVLRINICGENRHLRQARNRCARLYLNRRAKKHGKKNYVQNKIYYIFVQIN
jgi:hypothetical protein